MSEPKVTYGIMVQLVTRHGFTSLVAQVMARDGEASYPRGMCGRWYPNDGVPCADGLRLDGSISQYRDEPARFYLSAPEYRDVFSIELAQAKGMAAMLTKIAAQREKDAAHEHGDVFLAFARAVGAKWVCFEARRQSPARGTSWADTRWIWYGLTDGRNEYRYRIAEMVREADEATAARLKPVEPVAATDMLIDMNDRGSPTSVANVIAMADRLAAGEPA